MTEAGQQLFEYTKQILKMVSNAERVLKDISNLEIGTLSIGASSTIGTYLLPIWLSEFIAAYPNIELSAQIRNSREIIAKVLSGDLNLGFVAGPIHVDNLNIYTMLEDEILLVCSPSHPLADKKLPSVSVLENEVFILRESGSYTRLLVESILSDLKIKPTKIIELGNTESIKRMIMNSSTLGFLSRHAISLELDNHMLCVIKALAKRPFHSIYAKGAHLSPAGRAFLSMANKSRLKF